MNKKLGFYSSITAGICTVIFFVSMIISNAWLSYFSCLFLSWSYVLLACAFAHYAAEDRKAAAYGGIAIAVIYSVFTNLVYYSQLTTVFFQTASPDFLSEITYSPGSWMFGLDLMGYGLMALSTFLIGLTIEAINQTDKFLKVMLLLHGAFFPFCVIAPMLNLFKQGSDDISGIVPLLFWCLYFTPITVLSAIHFMKINKVKSV